MPGLLYLDTARLGLMSPTAQQAQREFAELAGERGGALYFERFLARGAADWSPAERRRFPALALWEGVAGLKHALRRLAGGRADHPVFLANRSAQLMKLAARLLFRTCRHVLTVDASWPPYLAVLAAERDRASRRTTTVPVRRAAFEGRATASDLAALVADAYRRGGCDGLFLPAVSHDGLVLPAEAIARRAAAVGEVRFVAVDGAQEFCHRPADIDRGYCDLYLAGCHKWLGACHPLGVGFYGRARSRGVIRRAVAELVESGELDDPLLRFTAQLETGRTDGTTETAAVAGLFTAMGAAHDRLGGPGLGEVLGGRLANRALVEPLAAATGWTAVRPGAEDLRSAILLLRGGRAAKPRSGAALRAALHDRGVAATAYDGGQVRLSLSDRPLTPAELATLNAALSLSS